MNIRYYTLQDKAALLSILRLNTPSFFDPSEEKDFIHYLDHETELYYIVEMENGIAGSGGINFAADRTTGIISWDMFHPNVQRKGLGTTLLNYRMDILKQHNVQEIVVRTSQLSYRFYEKNGFTLLETKKNYWAPGFDLYYMKYRTRQ